MAVAWALGVWADNSWVGMNGGPPNAWRGESTVTEVPGSGGGRARGRLAKKPKVKVIRWSDFATREERAQALAAALAEKAVPIQALPDEVDPFEDEDEAIIHALLLSRIIH